MNRKKSNPENTNKQQNRRVVYIWHQGCGGATKNLLYNKIWVSEEELML